MIHCNKCKHEFLPRVRTKYIKNDIEEVFFNCPNCHERYTAYYTNDEIKELQKNLIYHSRRNGKHILVERLQEELEKEMNRLEELIGTHY